MDKEKEITLKLTVGQLNTLCSAVGIAVDKLSENIQSINKAYASNFIKTLEKLEDLEALLDEAYRRYENGERGED